MPYSALPEQMMTSAAAPGRQGGLRQLGFDMLAFLIVAGFFVFITWGVVELSAPIGELGQDEIHLSPDWLPYYALRTTLRMLIAACVSILFTLVYATLAAKSEKAGQILIPILDVLQSVPVLGYIAFTVTGFIALFPRSMMGVECAAIFAIFTAQAWNMTFSLYQSLRTLPHDMHEASYVYRLSGWQKFWKVELPFAMPGLVWNMMMSMSAGWFFVVASEAITLGNKALLLPGMGSYIAVAIAARDVTAIYWAVAAMGVVILLYDQLLFRPLVAWASKFRYESTPGQAEPESWLLNLFAKSRLANWLLAPVGRTLRAIGRWRLFPWQAHGFAFFSRREARMFNFLWYVALAMLGLLCLHYLAAFFHTSVTWDDIVQVCAFAACTFLRVTVLILLASLIWVPVGVYVGLRPRWARVVQPVAQFCAAFPANLLFPFFVIAISTYKLNPDIWLSPLMILGTQWYILFNVVAGASVFPGDLQDASRNFSVRGWLWWKRVILPGIFPYYLTGAITAYGGAWNASIVSELVSWGETSYAATGLGAYIAQMTQRGDFVHTALGIGMMAFVVASFNRLVWRRLFDFAVRVLRLD